MSELEQMVDDCVNRQEQLNDWEVNFIADISTRLGEGVLLSQKQEDKLNQIWERVSSVRVKL